MNKRKDENIINDMGINDLFIDGKEYRDYNNNVKEMLIKTSNKQSKNLVLLDLCCGRGGDLGKWQKIDPYAKVVGVDTCENSVNQAIHRYHNVYKKKDRRMRAYFIKKIDLTEQSAMHDIGSILKRRRLTEFGNFNVVSCQMALNYFLESDIVLLNIFEITSKALKKGGIACFSFMNGHKVLELLGEESSYMGKGIYLEKLYTEELSERNLNDYGLMYKVFIADSNNVESYFQMKGMNTEFLTFPETIEWLVKCEKQLRLRYWSPSSSQSPKRSYDFCPRRDGTISSLFSYFYLEKF